MFKTLSQNAATLDNLGGNHLPPVLLNVDRNLQGCVDAGVYYALHFFDDLTQCGLHDHIALCTHEFLGQINQTLAAQNHANPLNQQLCINAFVAGYMGRIQQELRLFHGKTNAPNHYPSAKNNREGEPCLH